MIGIIVPTILFTGCKKDEETENLSCETTGEFTDNRDEQVYKCVKIGNQTWMAENLNYETENSYFYDDNPANCNVYGRLYNWDAAMTACPTGWHLPSDGEWKTLEMYLGMSQSQADISGWRGTDEGIQMKSTSSWNNKGNGTNSSGFNALAGGAFNFGGFFIDLGYASYWWSATEDATEEGAWLAWDCSLQFGEDKVGRPHEDKTNYFSVRCLKD